MLKQTQQTVGEEGRSLQLLGNIRTKRDEQQQPMESESEDSNSEQQQSQALMLSGINTFVVCTIN